MALVTVAEVKSYTSLGDGDNAIITTLIPAVQSSIENYCDRLFDAQDYSIWTYYSNEIMLENYPINYVKFIGYVNEVAVFTDTTDNNQYTYEVTASRELGTLVSLAITDNALTTTTFAFATYTNLTLLKAAVELAIPAITMTITSGFETMSYKLLKQGTGRYLYGAERSNATTMITDNRTLVIMQSLDFLFNSDLYMTTPIYIVYNAGYATADVPAALKQITSNIIKDCTSVVNSKLSTLMKSESLTNYSYTLSDSSTINEVVSNYSVELDFYRKKSI
jgi:hypothetical protein